MTKNQPAAYWVMLAMSLVFSILAVVTLVPNPGALKPNVLGYRSVCSFAPAATALCGLLAGAACTLRNRVVSRNAASRRYQPFIAPAAVAVLLAGLALYFGVRFSAVQSGFQNVIARTGPDRAVLTALADGTRTATASEGDISATVTLTVRSGRIEELTLRAGRNVEQSLAARIFEAVRTSQSTRVDAVSGSTASSKVLLKAVETAAGSR